MACRQAVTSFVATPRRSVAGLGRSDTSCSDTRIHHEALKTLTEQKVGSRYFCFQKGGVGLRTNPAEFPICSIPPMAWICLNEVRALSDQRRICRHLGQRSGPGCPEPMVRSRWLALFFLQLLRLHCRGQQQRGGVLEREATIRYTRAIGLASRELVQTTDNTKRVYSVWLVVWRPTAQGLTVIVVGVRPG
jgi:hypothetical protein